MRYLILLLLASCISEVVPEATSCDEYVAEIRKHSALCNVQPPNMDGMCDGLVVTNPSELRDDCIPAIAVMSCPAFEAKQFCKPEGLKL